ncbi:MAG TPA: glutathione S-transferase family protein [Kiloniellaceae bacterium]|nr:glutathione S-transferase family protein [Kiloniellaceae bacterium]
MTPDQPFVLYGHQESGNVYKVALMLALCGQSFQFRQVDIFAGETKTPRFLELNHFGEVPLLCHGKRQLAQSAAILQYLAETLDRFGPVNEDHRWAIAEWLFWDNHRLLPGLALTRFLQRFTPDADPAVLAFSRKRAEAALGRLEEVLASRPYLTGSLPTIADICCAGYIWFIDQAGLDPARWPAVATWSARLEALPGWQHPYDLLPTSDAAIQL